MSIIKNNKQHVGRKRGNFGKSQNFLESPSKKKGKKKKNTEEGKKKKKAHGRETTKKKLQKKLKKRYEGFDPVETPANPRANLLVQDKKEFEG